jgi:hypothetical protein
MQPMKAHFERYKPNNSTLLEVTIARKMLPHPQGMKGRMRNLLNKGLFI